MSNQYRTLGDDEIIRKGDVYTVYHDMAPEDVPKDFVQMSVKRAKALYPGFWFGRTVEESIE
jgi:hypothetical protein